MAMNMPNTGPLVQDQHTSFNWEQLFSFEDLLHVASLNLGINHLYLFQICPFLQENASSELKRHEENATVQIQAGIAQDLLYSQRSGNVVYLKIKVLNLMGNSQWQFTDWN